MTKNENQTQSASTSNIETFKMVTEMLQAEDAGFSEEEIAFLDAIANQTEFNNADVFMIDEIYQRRM